MAAGPPGRKCEGSTTKLSRLPLAGPRLAADTRAADQSISRLNRQRPQTPSCGGHSPYRGENSGPGRNLMESLTSRSRVREQPRLLDAAAAPHAPARPEAILPVRLPASALAWMAGLGSTHEMGRQIFRNAVPYAASMRLTLILRSRSRDRARSKANCMPSQVSGVEPKAFDSR